MAIPIKTLFCLKKFTTAPINKTLPTALPTTLSVLIASLFAVHFAHFVVTESPERDTT